MFREALAETVDVDIQCALVNLSCEPLLLRVCKLLLSLFRLNWPGLQTCKLTKESLKLFLLLCKLHSK